MGSGTTITKSTQLKPVCPCFCLGNIDEQHTICIMIPLFLHPTLCVVYTVIEWFPVVNPAVWRSLKQMECPATLWSVGAFLLQVDFALVKGLSCREIIMLPKAYSWATNTYTANFGNKHMFSLKDYMTKIQTLSPLCRDGLILFLYHWRKWSCLPSFLTIMKRPKFYKQHLP